MSKAKKQKAGNEKYLKPLGQAQISASQQFEAAHQAMLREAGAQLDNTIRGRTTGDVWQTLKGDMGSKNLARGDSVAQPTFEGLATSAIGGAMRGGTNSAQKLHDDVLHAGATSRLANAQVSGRSAREEARIVSEENANKAALATEASNNRVGLAATLASFGATHYGGQYMDLKATDARTAQSVARSQSANDALAASLAGPLPPFTGRQIPYRPGGWGIASTTNPYGTLR